VPVDILFYLLETVFVALTVNERDIRESSQTSAAGAVSSPSTDFAYFSIRLRIALLSRAFPPTNLFRESRPSLHSRVHGGCRHDLFDSSDRGGGVR